MKRDLYNYFIIEVQCVWLKSNHFADSRIFTLKVVQFLLLVSTNSPSWRSTAYIFCVLVRSESVLCQYWVWWYKHSKFQYHHKFWSYLGEERETYLTTFLPLPFHLPSSGKETLNQFCRRKAVLYFNLFFPLLIPPQRSTSS